MPDAVLTRERILEAAEDALRRYGPAKANVVDVARALAVSHGSVYRHFPSKASLRDAVTERWLGGLLTNFATVKKQTKRLKELEAGVSEEQALGTVLPWLSDERTMELAAEAVELYCWDRLGSDN